MAGRFVFALRIDGGTADVLTLHDSYEGAVSALLREGARLYKARFSYVPRELSPVAAHVLAAMSDVAATRVMEAVDRLEGGGWRARITELPVEDGHRTQDDPNPERRDWARRGAASL